MGGLVRKGVRLGLVHAGRGSGGGDEGPFSAAPVQNSRSPFRLPRSCAKIEAMKTLSSSVWPGYGIAGAGVALATLVQLPLRRLYATEHPFAFFYIALV